jgi:hypothetical protein
MVEFGGSRASDVNALSIGSKSDLSSAWFMHIFMHISGPFAWTHKAGRAFTGEFP